MQGLLSGTLDSHPFLLLLWGESQIVIAVFWMKILRILFQWIKLSTETGPEQNREPGNFCVTCASKHFYFTLKYITDDKTNKLRIIQASGLPVPPNLPIFCVSLPLSFTTGHPWVYTELEVIIQNIMNLGSHSQIWKQSTQTLAVLT